MPNKAAIPGLLKARKIVLKLKKTLGRSRESYAHGWRQALKQAEAEIEKQILIAQND